MAVVILAEKLGLPATATPEAIAEKVHLLVEEKAEALALAERWRTEAQTLQAEVIESREAVSKARKFEGELLVDKAIADQKIDASEREFFLATYNDGPKGAERVKKLIEDREWTNFRARKMSLGTPTENVSVFDEVTQKAEKYLADHKDEKISLAEAKLKVLGADVALSERYRMATVLGAQGGNR